MIGAKFVSVLAAANRGDAGKFDELWRDLNPSLLRYLRVLAGDQADAVTLQTWADITRGMGSFRGDEAAWRSWTFDIARRNALAAHHSSSHSTPDAPAAPGASDREPAHSGGQATLQDVVTTLALDLVSALPRVHAEVLLLRTVGELSVDDTARLLQRSKRAVRAAGYRAAVTVGSAEVWRERRAVVGSSTPASAIARPDPRAEELGLQRFEQLLGGAAVSPDEPVDVQRLADVLAALCAPPTAAELHDSAPAYAQYCRHVVHAPERARVAVAFGSRLAAAVTAAASVALGGATVAAYAGILPAPLQQVAHDWINAPAASSGESSPPGDGGASPQPAGPTSLPSEVGTPTPGGSASASRRPSPSASPSPTAPGLPGLQLPSEVPSAPGTPSGVPSDTPASATPTPEVTPSAPPSEPEPTPTTSHGPPTDIPSHGRPTTTPPRPSKPPQAGGTGGGAGRTARP